MTIRETPEVRRPWMARGAIAGAKGLPGGAFAPRNIHTHARFRTECQSFLCCRDTRLTISSKQRSGRAAAPPKAESQVRNLSGAPNLQPCRMKLGTLLAGYIAFGRTPSARQFRSNGKNAQGAVTHLGLSRTRHIRSFAAVPSGFRYGRGAPLRSFRRPSETNAALNSGHLPAA